VPRADLAQLTAQQQELAQQLERASIRLDELGKRIGRLVIASEPRR